MQLYKFDLCVFLETRLAGDSLKRFRRRIARSWSSYAIEAVGLSGGIVAIWRDAEIQINTFHQCNQQLGLLVSERSSDPWLLSAVYASTDFRERRALWSELTSLLAQGIPSIIVGDFNCITEASEKRGGRRFSNSVDVIEFRSFIGAAELMDLGFSGPRFTWCNNRLGSARVWERLDRALASAQWLQLFPNASVSHLDRIASDHCPIMVSTETDRHVRKLFHFERFWSLHSAARSIISQVWHLPIRGTVIYKLSRRLMLLRRRLSSWNRLEVGDLTRQVEQTEATINSLQAKEDQQGFISDSDLVMLRQKLALHHSLLRQQEMYWKQRSRIQWIREGDRNTRFFHQATLKRRATNRIRMIIDDNGNRLEEIQAIRSHLVHFFQSRWSVSTGSGDPVSQVYESKKVSHSENALLVRPIHDDEVRKALWDLGPDKAPGSDGFPPFFFQHYWAIVGREVCQAIQKVFQSKNIPEEWNRTLITLVPKRPNAALPEHYRPISLCTTLYKICARLLATRLRMVIPRIISTEQGAFIRGRSISDNILITQEFMHDLNKAPARQCLMAIKLDMERAYDRISWDFLNRTLQEFGFDKLLIEWVSACIHRPSFSLIINGSLSDHFHSSVGLRQGCPLSPLLFILAADDLSRAFHLAEHLRKIVPFQAAGGGPSVSHLLFADDCILLGPANSKNARSFKSIIQQYCQASGQKVNLLKSSICFSPKTNRSIRESICNMLNISTQSDRFMYLGIPMTGRRPRCSDFVDLERRVRSRLEGWQVTGLSMMARITIIRSVLSSLPLYLLSNALIPKTCLRRIERCFRDFLWASMQDGHGLHLLSWDSVCTPIQDGGLGIQSLLTRRQALLARHASRFLLEPNCLWSSLMRARYGEWKAGEPIIPPRGCSPFWKEVCGYGDYIMDNISWIIGDGQAIDVMEDTWLSEISLSRWPSFISTEVPNNLKVKDLIAPGSSSWITASVSKLFGNDLAQRILSVPLISSPSADVRLWKRSSVTKAPLKDLINFVRPEDQYQIEAAWVWAIPSLPRVQLFVWKLLRDCLPTAVFLAHRGMSIQVYCSLCGMDDESSDHAIFQCPRARLIWNMVGYRGRLDDSMSPRAQFLLDIQKGQKNKRGLWAVTAYQIWLSRNQLLFSEDSITTQQVVRKIRYMSAEYIHANRNDGFDFSGHWGSPAAPAANRHTVFISWEPPPPGLVKVNFDGSVRGRYAGSAFVIRGSQGNLLAAGGFSSLDSSVPMTELYAAWAGISYAKKILQAPGMVIEGDSITVIRWLRKENIPTGLVNPILGDIWTTLQGCSAQINHIYREANSAADWAAASVAQHSGFWIWKPADPYHPVFSQILASDVAGYSRARIV